MVTRDQRIRERGESGRGVGDTFQLSHPVSKYHLKGPVESLKHTAGPQCVYLTRDSQQLIIYPRDPNLCLIADYLHCECQGPM